MKKTLMIVVLTLLLVLVSVFTGCTEDDPGYGFLVDLDGDVAIVDDATGAIVAIDNDHHQIHEGNHFVCSEMFTLPLNNVLDIQITTPNTTEWAHMTAEFDVESETEWWVYENVTINVAGAACGEFNLDRNSIHTNTTQLATITNANIANANADTAVAGATMLFHGIAGAGKKVGGQSGQRQELILAQDEDYTIRFEATAAGYVVFQLRWYEHVNL